MRLLKGAMIGGIVATGLYMMYSENMEGARRRLFRRGKRIIKKMGII